MDYTLLRVDQSKEEAVQDAVDFIRFKNLHRIMLINDDGSHIPSHQLLTFNILFPFLQPGGVYMIEDIETSYWNAQIYGYPVEAGYKHPRSVVERFKSIADVVNTEFLIPAAIEAVLVAAGCPATPLYDDNLPARLEGEEEAGYLDRRRLHRLRRPYGESTDCGEWGIHAAVLNDIATITFAYNVVIITKIGPEDDGYVGRNYRLTPNLRDSIIY